MCNYNDSYYHDIVYIIVIILIDKSIENNRDNNRIDIRNNHYWMGFASSNISTSSTYNMCNSSSTPTSVDMSASGDSSIDLSSPYH